MSTFERLKKTAFLSLLIRHRVGVLISMIVFITVVSLVLNLLPAKDLPHILLNETFMHFADYLLYSFFLTMYFYFQDRFSYAKKHYYFASFFLLFPLSVLIEIAQIFIPGRSFEYSDISANVTGILLGIFLCRALALILFRGTRIENMRNE